MRCLSDFGNLVKFKRSIMLNYYFSRIGLIGNVKQQILNVKQQICPHKPRSHSICIHMYMAIVSYAQECNYHLTCDGTTTCTFGPAGYIS